MIPKSQLISLSEVPGMGPRRIRALLRKFPELEDITNLSKSDMMQVEGISGDLAAKTKGIDLDIGNRAMDKTASMGAKYFTYWDSDYPEHLKTIYDAPVGIFVMGDIPQLPCMGIVGTRQPSPYGKKMVKILTLDLMKAGFCIVSGFARGIDTWAHKTVHKYNGSTIAVFGNGLDICYPGENRKLWELLLENGAFISEFIPGTKPDAVNFPKRNRIISGLSKGVLVIEAGKKSGAIITALNALNQNREVFALPGQTDSSKSIGTNRLIQQGARLVTNVDDILSEFQLLPPKQVELLPELNCEEELIFQQLSQNPIHIDALCIQLKKDTPEVLSTLLMLELKNIVQQHPGKLFTKSI